MSASLRFCIYGAGAVGGMIGALLARAGATVSVVAHGETLAAIRRDGLRLITGGETLHAQVRASAAPSELGIQDYVIVSVKAPAMRVVAAEIAPLLGPQTAVVTAMNGIPWWFFAHASGPLAARRSRRSIQMARSPARSRRRAPSAACSMSAARATRRV